MKKKLASIVVVGIVAVSLVTPNFNSSESKAINELYNENDGGWQSYLDLDDKNENMSLIKIYDENDGGWQSNINISIS